MAWFPCNIGGGSSKPVTKSVSYLKWQITKLRGNPPASASLQMAEFYLYTKSGKYSWASGVSITADLQGTSGETIDKLIDNDISTKYNSSEWGQSQTGECNIVISLGETIVLDGDCGYSYVTANDETSRDPISWKLYGSEDGTSWFVLDEINDAIYVPTERRMESSEFLFKGLRSDRDIDTKALLYSINESQGGAWINSNIDTTEFAELYFEYTDSSSGADYTARVKIEDIVVYTGGADVFTTIFPAAVSGWAFNVRIYNNSLYASFSGVGVSSKAVGIYKEIFVSGNATRVEGTFTSASTEFGIVDVSVGFKPDLVMVFMKLSGGNQDTCSYWEKNASWAETSAIWCLIPAEASSYLVALGREYGETGIQQINNDGFSYMSNGVNTRSVVCQYVAVKYDIIPEPQSDEIVLFENGQFKNTDKVTLDLTSDYQISDGYIEFGPTSSSVSGFTFATNTLTDKYLAYIVGENSGSYQFTMQYGVSTIGYTVDQVISSGTGRVSYETINISSGSPFVISVLQGTSDITQGIFMGNHSGNGYEYKISKISLIPYT